MAAIFEQCNEAVHSLGDLLIQWGNPEMAAANQRSPVADHPMMKFEHAFWAAAAYLSFVFIAPIIVKSIYGPEIPPRVSGSVVHQRH